jgi:hypothetical protein
MHILMYVHSVVVLCCMYIVLYCIVLYVHSVVCAVLYVHSAVCAVLYVHSVGPICGQ